MNLIGLMEGYAVTAPQDQHMDTFRFDFLTGNGDWLDIQYIIIDNDGIFKEKRKVVCHLSGDFILICCMVVCKNSSLTNVC